MDLFHRESTFDSFTKIDEAALSLSFESSHFPCFIKYLYIIHQNIYYQIRVIKTKLKLQYH